MTAKECPCRIDRLFINEQVFIGELRAVGSQPERFKHVVHLVLKVVLFRAVIEADDREYHHPNADGLPTTYELSDRLARVEEKQNYVAERIDALTESIDNKIDLPAISPDVRVTVTNDSDGEQSVSGVLHFT